MQGSAVRIFEISNRIEWLLTIRFDSKPMKLFEIFKYLSLVYTGDLNAVFGNYYRQKLFHSIRNEKPLFAQH